MALLPGPVSIAKAGSPLRASDIEGLNARLRGLEANHGGRGFSRIGSVTAAGDDWQNPYIPVKSNSSSVIFKNSVFVIDVSTVSSPQTTYNIVDFPSKSSTGVIVTNESDDIPAKGYGFATIIGLSKPIKVKADAIHSPTAVSQCGPYSGNNLASSMGSGLLCLSSMDSDGMIDVVYSPNGGVTNISFLVVSSGTLTVLGYVLSWNSGYSLLDVPGDISIGMGSTPTGVVQICDVKGCIFNEPADQLFGRIGTATYRSSITAGTCRTGYPPFPPIWEADTLCCAKPLCAFDGGTT